MKARRVLTAPGRGLKALTSMVFRRSSWRMWGLPRTRLNYRQEVGDGSGSSTVMAPLLWIGRNFPEAPPAIWRLVGEGEEERVAPHDLLRLLERPNPHYSGAVLWMATLADWNISGDAYWLKIRNQAGAVRELWFTPSALLEPQGSEREFITHYTYRPGDGREITLEPADVVHFRYGLDPDDQRRGRSPLKSVLREIFTDDEAAAFTASLLRNMGVPGLVVSPEGDHSPGEDDVKATKAYVHQEFRGDKRGEPLVMSGPTKLQQFGFSPEQLDLKGLRRVPEERVSAVLGIPAVVCGLGAGLDRSTYNNVSEARSSAFEDNIIPAQRILAEDIRFQLLPDFEKNPWAFRVGFDLSNVRVLQEDRKAQVERLDIGVRGGWIRIAEARRAMDFDTEEADEVYLRPVSAFEVPAGTVSPPPSTRDPAEPKYRKRATRAQTRLVVALERDGRALEAAMAEELESDFSELGREAAEVFADVIPPDAVVSRTNGHRKADEDTLSQRVIAALSLDEWANGRLRSRFEAHYRRTAERTVTTVNSVLDLGVSLPDERMRRIVHEGGTRKGLADIVEATRDAISRSIATGREAGEGPIEIARRIRSEVPAGRYVNAGPAYRAKLIARTETKWAQNLSSVETYREADSVTHVIAFDARLGESDEDCMARDGQTFTFDQAEAEMAAEHPNGTLSFAPVVAETLSDLVPA